VGNQLVMTFIYNNSLLCVALIFVLRHQIMCIKIYLCIILIKYSLLLFWLWTAAWKEILGPINLVGLLLSIWKLEMMLVVVSSI